MYVGFDRQGNYTIWLPFPATPDGLVTYSGHYKLLGDGRYEAELESFSPAQYCVGSICVPTPVQEPIGTAFTCSYQPNPPLLMSIDCGLGPQRYDFYKPLP
jgi:hypothetical protein